MSDYIKVISPAKINLFLDVLGKREDNYHQVELVMQSLNLSDLVRVEVNKFQKEKLKISSNREDVPAGEENLAYKAVDLLTKGYHIPPLEIHIDKKIPVEAGLAGGSSNAAAVLWGLNELFSLKISLDELCKLGTKLGADVPFCLKGGTMLATGIGDKLDFLPPLPECYILVVKPDLKVSTKKVYKGLNKGIYRQNEHNNKQALNEIIKALKKEDVGKIADNLYNAMEPLVSSWHYQINEIKEMLLQSGAKGALMSGSGPTVYGLFCEAKKGELAEKMLRSWGQKVQVFLTTPRNMGVGKE